MIIELGKRYKTREGGSIIIRWSDSDNPHKAFGGQLIEADGTYRSAAFTAYGQFIPGVPNHRFDLIEEVELNIPNKIQWIIDVKNQLGKKALTPEMIKRIHKAYHRKYIKTYSS